MMLARVKVEIKGEAIVIVDVPDTIDPEDYEFDEKARDLAVARLDHPGGWFRYTCLDCSDTITLDQLQAEGDDVRPVEDQPCP